MTKLTPRKWNAVRARYEAGDAFSALSKDFGPHEVTIRNRAKREGWQRNLVVQGETSLSQEKSPLERKGNSPVAPAKPLDEIGKEVRSKLASNIQTTLERVSELRPEDMREEVQLETVLGSLTKRASTVFGWSETQSNVLVSVGLLGALPDRETDVTPPREERVE